mmetsp:Transcript_27447/g.52271  ORF Transcript_27447/g.52271 Transcript_27447/m.52271 type:complete len:182 (+) Transcript_27447:57-602(+)
MALCMASLTACLPEVAQVGRRTTTTSPRMCVATGPKQLVARVAQQSSVLAGRAIGGVQNGALVFMMRHKCKVPRLGRPADQRKALIRGLTTELLRNGRITTTEARAKAIRPYVDHMITLAKGGSTHQRRQAISFLYDKQLVHSLFNEVPNRYGERDGGYTRIFHTNSRRGDNAPMRIIELV